MPPISFEDLVYKPMGTSHTEGPLCSAGVDVASDPRAPSLAKIVEPEEIQSKTGRSRMRFHNVPVVEAQENYCMSDCCGYYGISCCI